MRASRKKRATRVKPAKNTAKRRGSDITARLLRQARELGVKSFIVMPIDEIQLGFKLARRPRASVVPKLLELAEHSNMHARRIALSALRHMKAWDHPGVLELFVRALGDAQGWVRYDAAWALGASGTSDARAIAELRKLARDALDDPPLDDDDAQAATRAKESLAQLLAVAP